MNKENLLLDELRSLLKDVEVEYFDGTKETFADVHIGSLPDSVGYPVVTLIPIGPVFSAEVLGRQTLDRRTRTVGVNVEVDYEHHDKELGIRYMSDILWTIAGVLLDNANPAGAEILELGEVDYAYAISDEDDGTTEENLIPDWGYKGKAVIPVYAAWRYRR